MLSGEPATGRLIPVSGRSPEGSGRSVTRRAGLVMSADIHATSAGQRQSWSGQCPRTAATILHIHVSRSVQDIRVRPVAEADLPAWRMYRTGYGRQGSGGQPAGTGCRAARENGMVVRSRGYPACRAVAASRPEPVRPVIPGMARASLLKYGASTAYSTMAAIQPATSSGRL